MFKISLILLCLVLQCFTFVPSVSEFFTLLSWFHTESIPDTDTDSTLDDEFCGAKKDGVLPPRGAPLPWF